MERTLPQVRALQLPCKPPADGSQDGYREEDLEQRPPFPHPCLHRWCIVLNEHGAVCRRGCTRPWSLIVCPSHPLHCFEGEGFMIRKLLVLALLACSGTVLKSSAADDSAAQPKPVMTAAY